MATRSKILLNKEFTAKGDILIGTASNASDNLPVGTNGQIVVAASGETTGLEWQDLNGSSFVFDETPTETPDGSETNFSSAFVFATGKMAVYKNGVKMTATEDYSEDGDNNGVTFVTAPITGSVIRLEYLKSDGVLIGDTSYRVSNEVPTGLINSSNTVYDTANAFIAGTIEVFLNGQLQEITTNYVETDTNTITFTTDTIPQTGDTVTVHYQKGLAAAGDALTLDGKSAPTGDIVGLTDTQTLTNKTLTAPVLNGALSGDAKATGTTINTGTADDDFVTSKAIADSELVTTESWTALSSEFSNSWVNYGGGTYEDAGYMKTIDGFVHLRGWIKDGTIDAIAFTLPTGYRPSKYVTFACVSNGAFGWARVHSDGKVYVIVGDNTWFSLNEISFKIG